MHGAPWLGVPAMQSPAIPTALQLGIRCEDYKRGLAKRSVTNTRENELAFSTRPTEVKTSWSHQSSCFCLLHC